MSTLLTVALLSFLLQFSKSLVSIFMYFIRRLAKPSQNELDLSAKLKKAREAVKKYELPCDNDNRYIWTIRCLRAKKQAEDLEEEISNLHKSKRLHLKYVDFFANYALKALLSFILAVVTFRNRYTPVLIYADEVNLQPLQGLLSFPTGIPNAVSVLMWLFSCNTSFHLLARGQIKMMT